MLPTTRSKLIAATIVIALVFGMIALTRRVEPTAAPAEAVALDDPLPAEREDRLSSRAVTDVVPFDSTETTTNAPAITNLYVRLSDGEFPRVSPEQLEGYLTQNRRSVGALLGALRASGDDSLLAEAKERFPDDPRVQFAAAYKTGSPEERQQWLEKFKQSDPQNALADYLLAAEHFKSGQAEQALQEITAAGSKPTMENYLLDFMQNAEEAYMGAGLSADTAKATAATSALLPEQAKLKQVGTDLVDLAKRYQQAGDEASAQAALQMAMNLGQRIDQSPQTTLIQELVGMAIERLALNAMKPDAPYGGTGQTVQDRIDALTAQRTTYKDLTTKSDPILRTMSEQDLARYFDRVKLFGDAAAMRWVISKSQTP